MQLMRIDHVQLAMPVGGEETARAFYQGVLGLDERPKPPDLASRGGCWFEQGDLKIHLGADPEFRPAHKAHPAFRVDDLAGLVARLKEHGYQVARDAPLDGDARAYAHDPFGNRIELIEAGVAAS